MKDGDRTTIHNFRLLRVSLARIAQQLGFESSTLPGAPPTWRYEDLWEASLTEDGWHAVSARITESIGKLQAVNQSTASDSTTE